MSGDDEYVSVLAELGLSTSQAKVYLSLARSKSLTAQAMSKVSGVARPDVYRVIAQLEKAGLVEKIIAKPVEFHAISIDKCVSGLMQRRIMKTAELQQKTLALTKNFGRSKAYEEPDEKFQFVLITERDAVYIRAERMLRNVQRCICFLGLRKRMIAWLSNYLPLFEEVLTRNVDCRMIMPLVVDQKTDVTLKGLRKYSNFAIRMMSVEPKAGFSVWDGKEILVSTSATDTPFPQPTLWSNDKAVVDLCQDYFEYLWKNAARID